MVWTIERLIEETGIDQSILEGIRDLQIKLDDEKAELNSQQIESIQTMLESMIGDMEINKQLAIIAPLSKQDTGIGSVNTSALKDMSYRTRNLAVIDSEMDKIWSNFQEVASGKKVLEENEKITLRQYGMLYDLANLNKSLEKFNNMGLIKGNASLEKLYARTQQASTMVSHMDQSFNQDFKMPVGAVVLDNTQKKSAIYGKELGFFDKIIAFFVTKFGHASKGMSVEKNGQTQNKISHINPTYQEENVSLRNYLYSDVYKVKIDNLIDNDTKTLLKEKLGDDWLAQVERKYAGIERQIHDGARSLHGHIDADDSKARFSQIATVGLQGGHKNFVMRDHTNSNVRDEVFGRGQWAQEGRRESAKMLCSEFVGKTVIAAVEELNDVLAAELREKGVEEIPEPLIKSPISEREKLHLLTPERLLHAMEERGAVEKVATPSSISQFVTKGDGEAMSSIDARAKMKALKSAEGAISSVKEEIQSSDEFTQRVTQSPS